MKKTCISLLLIAAALLLCACRAESPASSTNPADNGTVGEVCADALVTFEDDAAGNPLTSLSYRDGQAYSFEIMDADTVNSIYQALLAVPLGDTTSDPGISDADIVFSFSRESGKAFIVRFITPDCFLQYPSGGGQPQYYEVLDASLVRSCMDAALSANQSGEPPERPVFGDMIALDVAQNDFESIDFDGDGEDEGLFFDFIDNGDEAYDALVLTVDTKRENFQANFSPANRDNVFACIVPNADGGALLLITADAEGGYPSCLYFITVKNGKLLKYTLEDVEITDYENGVFTLSDMQQIAVADMHFETVKQ